jgi:hypothetical protein
MRKKFSNRLKNGFLKMSWGTGKDTGSFGIVPTKIFAKSMISVFTNGKIAINFGTLRGHESLKDFREDLARAFTQEMSVSLPEDYIKRYPNVSPKDWVPKIDTLIEIYKKLIEKYES